MKIYIHLFTILKPYGEGKLAEDGSFEIAEGTTLGEISGLLGLPPKRGKVYLVNERPKRPDYLCKESDKVKILSFIGGG